MNKPSDLLLGVIDFFGILIPGVVLYFMHGKTILSFLTFDMPVPKDDWIIIFVVSYVLGHFLLGLSVPFNKIAGRFRSPETGIYLDKIKTGINLPEKLQTATFYFYSAFSYIRLNSPAATAEIERQSAEYKLFRCLTLLFLLDLPIQTFVHEQAGDRLLFSVCGAALCFYRFQWLFDWTHYLVFDFYLQLKSNQEKESKK